MKLLSMKNLWWIGHEIFLLFLLRYNIEIFSLDISYNWRNAIEHYGWSHDAVVSIRGNGMQKCSVAIVHFDAVGDVVKQCEEYKNEYGVDSNPCRYQITSSFLLNIKILNHCNMARKIINFQSNQTIFLTHLFLSSLYQVEEIYRDRGFQK